MSNEAATPIRVLILEDNPADVEKAIRILQSNNFAPEWKCVTTKEEYLGSLDASYDLILADYHLRQFSAKEALHLHNERGLSIPFIIVSGTIMEETGVQMMKEGVRDYVFKDRLKRLGESVKRALAHKQLEEEKQKTSSALIQSELLFRQFAENCRDVFWMSSTTDENILFISRNFEKIWGIPPEATSFSRSGWLDTVLPEDRVRTAQALGIISTRPLLNPYIDYRIQRPDGSIRWIRDHAFQVKNEQGVTYRLGGIARDITHYKMSELKRNLRHSISLLVAEYDTLEEFAPRLIQTICEQMGWKIGIFWSVNPQTNTASYYTSWHIGNGPLENFVKNSRTMIFSSDQGLVGKVLATREASYVKKVMEKAYFAQAEAASLANLQEALAFPIFLKGQNFGVIEFFNSNIHGVDTDWLEFFNDISKQIGHFILRKNVEKSLHKSEERFKSIFESSSVGMALLSLEGKFLQVNDSFCAILGFSQEELKKMHLKEITLKDDLEKENFYQQKILTRDLQIYRTDKRFITKDRSTVWASVSAHLFTDNQNEPLYFIYEAQDISQRKHTEEKLSHLAYYDLLTGLPNRKLLEDTVNQTLLNASLMGEKVFVFFIKINRFKQINDTAGAEIGDLILKQFASRLYEKIQSKDMVGRWGGDEFVIVHSNLNSRESATLFAEKLLAVIKEPFAVEDRKFFLTINIGISIFPDDTTQAQLLLKNAYVATHLTKKGAASTFQFYSEDLLKQANEKNLIETHLRKAISQNEFTLYYQPIFDVKSGRITSIEALIRWNSKELGSVPTSKFLPIAEESGLILAIGEWVLRESCKAAKALAQEGLVSVLAINLSVLQIKEKNFVDLVHQIIQDFAIDPSLLRFEIVESLFMEHAKEFVDKINILRSEHIQFAIDDFGTGYSSFGMLREFSFDRFKIDISFIHNVAVDSINAQIVAGILAMSEALGIPAIAEGVETQQEFELLEKLGCKEMQGYYFTHPLPFDELKKFMREKKISKFLY